MGNYIPTYKLDGLSDHMLDAVLHKTVGDIQEYVGRHRAISIAHGRPVLYRMQFKELFEFKNSDKMFLVFDHDKDGKVDFFEILAVLILGSRVSPLAKFRMIFQLFDLRGRGQLDFGELVLLVLCTMRGLAKLIGTPLPTEEQVESQIKVAFSTRWRSDPGATVEFNLFSSWLRSRADVKELMQRFASSATSALKDKRLERKVHQYKTKNPDAYKLADQRKTPAVQSKVGSKWMKKVKGGDVATAKPVVFKRADAIILWQVYHSFRKDERGRVNAVAFKEELEGHELFKYSRACFGDISEVTDLYDHRMSFIDLLAKFHPLSPHEELISMAHDAAHHHAATDPGFERIIIDGDQREEVEQVLSMFHEEAHGQMTVAEVTAALASTGHFRQSTIATLFTELGISYDEYITRTELKNILAKSFRTGIANEGDYEVSDDEEDTGTMVTNTTYQN